MNLNIKAAGLIIVPLFIQIVVSSFGAHFGWGTNGTITGGLAAGTALPTGTWATITAGFSWFASALTFKLVDMGVLSLFMWFMVVCEIVGGILAALHSD